MRWTECPVIFFFVFSLAGHFFFFQNKVGHGERGIFAFDYVVDLQKRRGCIDHHVSVGACLTDDDVPCTPWPNGQYSPSMTSSSLLHLGFSYFTYGRFSAEHY